MNKKSGKMLKKREVQLAVMNLSFIFYNLLLTFDNHSDIVSSTGGVSQ
jgi:hypothetical protein